MHTPIYTHTHTHIHVHLCTFGFPHPPYWNKIKDNLAANMEKYLRMKQLIELSIKFLVRTCSLSMWLQVWVNVYMSSYASQCLIHRKCLTLHKCPQSLNHWVGKWPLWCPTSYPVHQHHLSQSLQLCLYWGKAYFPTFDLSFQHLTGDLLVHSCVYLADHHTRHKNITPC